MNEAQLSLKDEHREQYCNYHTTTASYMLEVEGRKEGINYQLDESMEFSFQAFTPIQILQKSEKVQTYNNGNIY